MNNVVYEELDEAKANLENLREQYRVKLESYERLKRSHDDQLGKNKEINSKLEKLTWDLNEKDNEISDIKQMYDDVKTKLTEKESIIKNLISAHDKFRSDFTDKLCKCEEENKVLYSSLDHANAKNVDQEKQIHALKLEIEGVKRVLASYEKKRLETENSAKKSEKGSEDVCLRLEEENRKIEYQLKWKKEQFGHIEEAYKKLRNELKTKENDWEMEKKSLLADVNGKNMDHEEQIHALKQEIEGLKRVLAYSEKKHPKAENSEELYKREDVCLRLEEEKSKLLSQLKWKKEQFGHLEEAHKRLRDEFKTKEKEWANEKNVLVNDISSLQMSSESQVRISQDGHRRLEMCNEALAHSESKKKLLEGELVESRTSFDNVCGEYEEAKSNFENLISQRDRELATLRSSLGTKEIVCKEMEYQFKKLEHENRDLLVIVKELQEEQIHEARIISSSKLQNKLKSLENAHKAKECEWRCKMEKLTKELISKNTSLNEMKVELEDCDSLMMNLELTNHETSIMLLVLKSGFAESCLRIARDRSYMEERICGLVEELEKKNEALKRVQNDLEDECEKVVVLAKKVEMLEEIQSTCQVEQIRRDLEKVNEELYQKYCEANEIEFELQIWKSMAEKMEINLKQNVRIRKEVEASLIGQIEVEMNLKQENERLGYLLKEKEKTINKLEKQLVAANKNTKSPEKEVLFQNLLEEKDERIYDLRQLFTSLENEFESSTGSFSSKLLQMQKENKCFHEKMKESEVLKEVEIQAKSVLIIELENEVCNLQQRVECREKAVFDYEMKTREIQTELEQMLCERIERSSVEDMKLMRSLRKIIETINIGGKSDDDEKDSVKENMDILSSSPLVKKVEVIHEERLPFRAINS